jgi:hypothetical protein
MLKNFFLALLIFILSGAILYVTILNLDPLGQQRIIAFSALFASGFFLITSFFSLLFFFASEIWAGKKLGSSAFLVALRRGTLVGFFLLGCSLLQLFRLIAPLEVGLWALFLILIEWVFLGGRDKNSAS